MMYRCVECGHPNESLYKIISPESIRISRCESCFQVVDKYIECEPVQTCLDAILHKSSAYRHLIHNSNITFTKKLCLLYLMCDMYASWQQLRPMSSSGGDPISEGQLLWLLVVTLCEWTTYYGIMFLLLHLFDVLASAKNDPRPSTSKARDHEQIFRALVLSSFGKLFSIPALIWPDMGGPICRLLITAFLVSSNIVALKAADVIRRESLLPLAVTMSCFLQNLVHRHFVSCDADLRALQSTEDSL